MSSLNYFNLEDTIAAIATPMGEGAIAIIRLSGQKAFSIANKVFSKPIFSLKSHRIYYGKILDQNKNIVDSVILLIMKNPNSYTGEDSIEIHCHGGQLITKKVFECVLQAGARAAMPGEFTFRSYKNGKIDLLQAEAVQELIAAKNDLALTAAENQLEGSLSSYISSFQKQLLEIASILEAYIDFPEEDIELSSSNHLCQLLQQTYDKMKKLHKTFHDGRIIFEGLKIAIIGPPNAGKSSLMNALLSKDRAIVTPIAGTTRDLIEDNIQIGQLHFKLIDTAGIRNTHDIIENKSIEKTKIATKKADIILLVFDASLEKHDLDLFYSYLLDKKTLVLWNKRDLCSDKKINSSNNIYISAKTKEGLDELKEKIISIIWKNGCPSKEEVIITNLRHKESLAKAIEFCQSVINGLKNNISYEFISADMRSSLEELNSIIGTNITEDILTNIFSKFCIGK